MPGADDIHVAMTCHLPGVVVGRRGTDWPECALEPEIALEVMVHGMVYGFGFTNRKRRQMYLSDGVTNYVGRAIVNGVNENAAIARVAEVFEKWPLAARR